MKSFKLAVALSAVLSLLLLSAPASGDTPADWFTCLAPSPTTAGVAADTDCTSHLHWADKSDWLRVDLPTSAVINEDETPANSGEGADDPDDEQPVGQSIVATNFSVDFDCSAGDDLNDGGTYDLTWEDTWSSYTVPSGWIKVAQWDTIVLAVTVPTHVIKNTSTGQYATVTDLPTTLTCTATATNLRVKTYSHESNNGAFEWVGKNPTPAGSYTVTATVTLTTGTTHVDTAPVTTT